MIAGPPLISVPPLQGAGSRKKSATKMPPANGGVPRIENVANVPADRSPPHSENVAVPGPCRPMLGWQSVHVNFSARNTSIAASVVVLAGLSEVQNRTRT